MAMTGTALDRAAQAARIPLARPIEVAEYLQKPEKTLAEWRSRGLGPRYLTVGRDVRYRWSDVEEWLAEQQTEPQPSRLTS
jgi:predicted DNA-binding transcriptional regulator AlpA